MTKYAPGGISGKTGATLELEVPVKGTPQAAPKPAPAPSPSPKPSANGGGGGGGGGQPDNPPGPAPAPNPDKKPSSSTRPDYPLLPEDLKARYLKMKFEVDGEPVEIDLEHLKYHNVGIHPEDKKETLRAVIQGLIREMQKNENDILVQLVGEKFATGTPAFAVWPFMGKGSPEQIQAVLKVCAHMKKRLGGDWPSGSSLSAQVQAFYKTNFGLDCNGFAGNYAAAISAPGLTPDTYIPTFAPASRRRSKLDDILPGDVIIWSSKHIATIQGKRDDGMFDIVESNGETEVQGLGNTIRKLAETGGDSFKIQKMHTVGPTAGQLGGTEEVYVATLK